MPVRQPDLRAFRSKAFPASFDTSWAPWQVEDNVLEHYEVEHAQQEKDLRIKKVLPIPTYEETKCKSMSIPTPHRILSFSGKAATRVETESARRNRQYRVEEARLSRLHQAKLVWQEMHLKDFKNNVRFTPKWHVDKARERNMTVEELNARYQWHLKLPDEKARFRSSDEKESLSWAERGKAHSVKPKAKRVGQVAARV
ncbi:hypothetical protein CBS101457_002190 [Exobasidium rhododendri]|nr:hypothetical protein CBS101457_002190 [Exobasidium rhododendri]